MPEDCSIMVTRNQWGQKDMPPRQITQLSQNHLHALLARNLISDLKSRGKKATVALAQISMNGNKWDPLFSPTGASDCPSCFPSKTHVRALFLSLSR
jgi:hypothetical protein